MTARSSLLTAIWSSFICWIERLINKLNSYLSCYLKWCFILEEYILRTNNEAYFVNTKFLNKKYKKRKITIILVNGYKMQDNLTCITITIMHIPKWSNIPCHIFIYHCNIHVMKRGILSFHAIYPGIHCHWISLVMSPLIGDGLYYMSWMALWVYLRDYVKHNGWRGFSLGESQLQCLRIGWY